MFHVKHFLSQWLLNEWLGLADVWPISVNFCRFGRLSCHIGKQGRKPKMFHVKHFDRLVW